MRALSNFSSGIRHRIVRIVMRWNASPRRARLYRMLGIAQHHLTYRASATPDKTSVVMASSGLRLTYRQVDDASLRAARLFRECGLRIGDGIAILMENHSSYFELCWAAQRSGLYYTPISSQLTAQEASRIINDCNAKLFITSERFADTAQQLLSLTPAVERRMVLDGPVAGYERFEALASHQEATPLPDETAGRSMLYSSGSTGRPKGVSGQLPGGPITMLPPIIDVFTRLFDVDAESVFLSSAPLYHAAPLGSMMAVQSRGGTCIVTNSFNAEETLRLIDEHKVTHVNLVPTMFVKLLKLPASVRERYDLSSLRFVIHGAAPCPIRIKEQMIGWWGPILYEYYSATEGNVFCVIDSRTWLKHKGSVGKPVLGPVHILDDDGQQQSSGQVGEIWSAAPSDFAYHNDPEQTAKCRNEKGWTTLGDIGYVDEEGFLYITDRKSFKIVSGGVNIFPREIEDVLIVHPQVMDVAVLGVPDQELGEAVKAVVQLVDSATATDELKKDLISYCSEHLARFKCPRSIDFVETLPRYDTGKLQKQLLKQRYWGNRTYVD